MDKATRMLTYGWFKNPLRDGDRTLEQQLVGLEPLLEEVHGKTVLDVGCAEGCISTRLGNAGAALVRGVEFLPGHVDMALQLNDSPACTFEVGDANDYQPTRDYDVVLLLAILHKLRNPSASCSTLVRAATSLCVIRFPGNSVDGSICDRRSNMVRHRINPVMTKRGFRLDRIEEGPFKEPTHYYRR